MKIVFVGCGFFCVCVVVVCFVFFFGVLWCFFVLFLFCFVFCPGDLLLQSWELGKQNETKQKTKEKTPKH